MNETLLIHYTPDPDSDISWPDPDQDRFSKAHLGFWIYLLTDCLLFSSLFVTYAVLHPNIFGGVSGKELFSLPLTFTQTIALLLSSLTSGLALLSAKKIHAQRAIAWLIVTAGLGMAFLFLEISEFQHMVAEGNDWSQSGFLSAFFALVGTHGLHIIVGLLWISVMVMQVAFQGITSDTFRRLVLFGLYWHFLDLIWIFIFTFVYLIGVL